MQHPASGATGPGVLRLVALAVLPLLLLAGVLVAVAHVGLPVATALPAEDIAIERVVVTPDGFVLHARSVGRDPAEVAQVAVNDLLVAFEASVSGPVERLDAVTFTVPFRWVEGEPYEIVLLTSTGFKFAAEVEAASATPEASTDAFLTLALLGVYVGVVPVLAGLFWRPVLERAPDAAVRFALGVTLGLLAFLALDAFLEGLEVAESAAGAFDPEILLVGGAIGAFALLLAVGSRMRSAGAAAPVAVAALVAVGIGLHNLAEGLAIGGAFALGQAALGLTLVVGFAVHNTTEGLAIVGPLTRKPVTLMALGGLGLVAGAPTILGAWIGGFAGNPYLALAFLAVGVGAIGAVIVEIDRAWAGALRAGAGLAGAAIGFAVMYVTGLFVVVG